MVAAFKIPCAILSFAWVFVLSYLFGMIQYQDKYAYIEYRDPLTDFVTLTCAYCISIAVLGCCCIKCDITHIIAAVIYILASIAAITGLCIYIVIRLRERNDFKMDQKTLLRVMREKYTCAREIPHYIHFTQTTYHCCGIYGYKDYRAFIIDFNSTQDVPFSCCKNESAGRQNSCPVVRVGYTEVIPGALPASAVTDLYLNQSAGKYTDNLPIPWTELRNRTKATYILHSLYGNASNVTRSTNQELPKWLIPDNDRLNSINSEGCYPYLLDNSATLYCAYMALVIFLLVGGIAMALLYVENCLRARRKALEYHQTLSQTQTDKQKCDPPK